MISTTEVSIMTIVSLYLKRLSAVSRKLIPSARCPHVFRSTCNEMIINFNLLIVYSRSQNIRMKTFIVLAAVAVVCSAKYIVDVQSGQLPCKPCNHDDIPLGQFKLLNPVCGPCGEMYGPSFEFCCMCDRKIRRACEEAIRK